MALEINNLKRIFLFKQNGTDLRLDDPNPSFSPDEVMAFYANQYPSLTTATVMEKSVNGDTQEYEFTDVVGTKG